MEQQQPSYSEKSSGKSGSSSNSSKPSSPHAWVGSDPLTPKASNVDLGAPLEPCYSIALGDRTEPRSTTDLLKTVTSPKKKPTPRMTLLETNQDYANEYSPRFLMTPRVSQRGETPVNIATAFTLAHVLSEGGDNTDEIFGERKDEGAQYGMGALGLFNGLFLNLIALVFVFLLPNTGRRRTWYCGGVIIGVLFQCAAIAYFVLLRSKK